MTGRPGAAAKARLLQWREQLIAELDREIDGGVDLDNYKALIECGADVLVAGNTVFSSKNPVETSTTYLSSEKRHLMYISTQMQIFYAFLSNLSSLNLTYQSLFFDRIKGIKFSSILFK